MPTTANLRDEYGSFVELVDACQAWCARVNARTHRETGAASNDRLAAERAHLHLLPAEPHAIALGEERLVGDDQTIRWGTVPYSTPDGHQGRKVWARVTGNELAITAATGTGLVEVARHELSVPRVPRIDDAHYPGHPGGNLPRPPRPRARTAAETAFLALGEGAHRWLVEAAAVGTVRVRVKMARAVELAAVVGDEAVDEALGLAAIAGRFAEGDLASIIDHLSGAELPDDVVHADETFSVQPGGAGAARRARPAAFAGPRPARPPRDRTFVAKAENVVLLGPAVIAGLILK